MIMTTIGGYQLFVHILSHSSNNNIMLMLMLIVKLLCDPYKGPEEPIRDATAGAIILEVLVSTLDLTESISSNDDCYKFIRVGQSIYKKSRDGGLRSDWENMVQSVSYVLLTMYRYAPPSHCFFVLLLLL